LRWEINPFFDGIRGQKSGFDTATGRLVVPSNADTSAQLFAAPQFAAFGDRMLFTKDIGRPNSIQYTSKRDFAPRLGLAWRPGGSNNWVMRMAYGLFFVAPDGNTLNNTGNSTPFVATQTVFNDSAPAAPTRTWADFFQGQRILPPNNPPGTRCDFGFVANSCATPGVSAGSLTMHSTYLQQWNLSVQRQLSAQMAVDLAYVGNKSTHLNQNWAINDPPPGSGAIQNRRPFPQWGPITYPVFDENGVYNALQAKVETRGWKDVSVFGAYTFSKCIDRGSSQGGATLLVLSLNRAVCDYDYPQNFSGSFDYQLPFGRGKKLLGGASTLMQQFIGGWELAGIVTVRSGQAFSPSVSGDPLNTGVGTRPDLIGQVLLLHKVNCWFYTSANAGCTALAPGAADAFAVPPARLRYGTAGRNILRGDPLRQFDYTVMKKFRFTEAKGLEFRAEFFNILNHATFSNPSTDINSSSGGQVASTVNAARVIQMALKFYF